MVEKKKKKTTAAVQQSVEYQLSELTASVGYTLSLHLWRHLTDANCNIAHAHKHEDVYNRMT